MKLKYGFNIFWSEDDGGYIATCPDFPGFMAFGETYEGAVKEAKSVLKMLIESYKERSKPLPDATVLSEYSGQIRLRMPKSLHKDLTIAAEKEGVSLNVYMVSLLAERRAAKDIATEIIEQMEHMQKKLVSEIKGSEESSRLQTSTPYISQVKGGYNVYTSH